MQKFTVFNNTEHSDLHARIFISFRRLFSKQQILLTNDEINININYCYYHIIQSKLSKFPYLTKQLSKFI